MNIVSELDLSDRFVEELENKHVYPVLSRLTDIGSIDNTIRVLRSKGRAVSFFIDFGDKIKSADVGFKFKLLRFILIELISGRYNVEQGKKLMELVLSDIFYLNMILFDREFIDLIYELLTKEEYGEVRKY